ncbi:MAG: multiheme c-type cytochrome [Syntrophobacteraceae bacterium]
MRRCLAFVFLAVAVVVLGAGVILSQPGYGRAGPKAPQARTAGQDLPQPDIERPLDQKKLPAKAQAQDGGSCVECHTRVTPGIVMDWQLSKHSRNEVGCPACHGDGHNSMTDVSGARVALPETCAQCHATQVDQFAKGKHALAWGAMKAMPTAHWQPMAQIEGLKGCGGCHRVGLKTEGEVRDLIEKGSGFGASSCDVCHTRHLFSADEARSPQACRTCHMGPDHSQWEMYSSSKHGVRFLLKQSRVLPEETAAPTCQSCHFQEGSHANRTAWGYFALRMPLPEDAQWAGDRTTILQGLGILDASGRETPRAEAMQSADAARLNNDDWQSERDRMLKMCNDCHSVNFARAELDKADQMIREADRLMADAIRVVAGLYEDGALKRPESYSYAFPDLLTFHDAPTVIEQKLFQMFHEYRMRTFQGAFHGNPEYTFWYGWSGMRRTLTEIKERAAEMSEARRAQGPPAGQPARPAGKR